MVACCAAGCAPPRLAGRAESEQRITACESLLIAAGDDTDAMFDANASLSERRLAARDAQHGWLDVAVQCPQRFAEGTLRSAQAQIVAERTASALGQTNQPLTVSRLDDVTALDVGGDALARLALAEDRAGFATEVLAGRFAAGEGSNAATAAMAADGSLLAMSGDHKQTASQMMHLARGAEDLRRKVYATADLVDVPDTMVDPATGLRANTVAVLEIDCAREELEAVRESGALTKTPGTDAERGRLRADLLQLSMLIATHAYTAFDLGYPYADFALFDAGTTD